MTDVPATRTLPAVLREIANPSRDYAPALSAGPGLQLIVGSCGETLPDPDSDSYARVIVNGQTVRVPKLANARTVMGAPAYLLALGDSMLLIGTVTPIGPMNTLSGNWGWITTTSGDPSPTRVGINGPGWDVAGGVTLRISKTTSAGTNLGPNLLRAGGMLIRLDAGASWAEYNQGATPVDNGTWVAIAIGNVRRSAGAPPPNGTPVTVSLIPF